MLMLTFRLLLVMIILILLMNNYFKSLKNIIILSLLVASTILFCFFSKSIYYNIAIIIINIPIIYFLLTQRTYQLASMTIIFSIVFILQNFYPANILLIFCIGIITTALTHFYNLRDTSNKEMNLFYAAVLGLILCQILFIYTAFAFSAMAVALFAILVYYLFLGLINLNIENNLKTVSIVRYGLVFIVCTAILIINNQYF